MNPWNWDAPSSGTWSNFGPTAPPTFDDLVRAQKAITEALAAKPRTTALVFPPFVPALRVDRRACRAWVEGIEVKRVPIEPGRIYYMPARTDLPFPAPDVLISADPMRTIRQLRRRVARAGHRGRRGAVAVPLALATGGAP